jgi:hypothetical protein
MISQGGVANSWSFKSPIGDAAWLNDLRVQSLPDDLAGGGDRGRETTRVDPLPDTFRDGAQALADGEMGRDGVFHASKIQAKCASKYEAKPTEKTAARRDGV